MEERLWEVEATLRARVQKLLGRTISARFPPTVRWTLNATKAFRRVAVTSNCSLNEGERTQNQLGGEARKTFEIFDSSRFVSSLHNIQFLRTLRVFTRQRLYTTHNVVWSSAEAILAIRRQSRGVLRFLRKVRTYKVRVFTSAASYR